MGHWIVVVIAVLVGCSDEAKPVQVAPAPPPAQPEPLRVELGECGPVDLKFVVGGHELALGYGTIGHGSGTGTAGGYSPFYSRRPDMDVPRVVVGVPHVNGDLDPNLVRRYIRRNMANIKYCYEQQLMIKRSLGGTVQTTWTITADGKVADLKASGVNATVASCMTAVIGAIEFPKPKSGTVTVSYPLKLEPGDGPVNATPPRPARPSTLPASDNPLRGQEPALATCLRNQPVPYGTAVVDISFDAGAVKQTAVHGLADPACVANVARSMKRAGAEPIELRCALAYGTMPASKLPMLTIDADGVIRWNGQPLVTDSSTLQQALGRELEAHFALSSGAIVNRGPILIKPLATTPMGVVQQLMSQIERSGAQWALVTAHAFGGDRLLGKVVLPVVPVPLQMQPRPTNQARPLMQIYERAISIRKRDGVNLELERGDWDALTAALAELHAATKRTDIDIGAAPAVPFGDVSRVIDIAAAAGFTDWPAPDQY